MQQSEHSGLSNGWQFIFDKEYENVIFLNQQSWPSGNDQSSVTVDLAVNQSYVSPCFNGCDTAWYDLSDIVETGQTTFYYGKTTLSNGDMISVWGTDSSADAELSGKKLYFSKDDFSNADTIVIGSVNGKISEKNAGDETVLYYEFPDGAGITQQSVIAIQSGENTYRFMWGDLSYNKVTVTENIAEVNETYVAAQTIYFDATLSKLDYVKTATDASGNEANDTLEPGSAIPATENGKVYYWIRKN